MQLLPPLVSSAGNVSSAGKVLLPLSGGAEQQLITALIRGRDFRGEASFVSAALAGDPAFALWTVLRAADSGAAAFEVPDALAAWLSAAALDALDWAGNPADNLASKTSANPPVAAETIDAWADLAARSLATAALAARIAAHCGLDPQPARLLGLVHLARQWIAASTAAAESIPASDALLPGYLVERLGAIDVQPRSRGKGKITSAVDCVAAALRLAASNRTPPKTLAGVKVDRQEFAAHVASAKRAWLAPAASGTLPPLVRKLKRLRSLECEYQRALETEKLDALKELAYGAGHEINNPLANISARAQTLLQLERDPDRRRLLAAINTQAFRAYEMIADMMLFARPPQPARARIDLGRLLREVVDELAAQATESGSQLSLHTPAAPVAICADKIQIAVAVRAVCVNALEAIDSGGRVEIELVEPAALATAVQINVTDNGPGIPEETRRHIFDPFYSGREAGRGLGFGLSKCWRIVTMHGGRIDVETTLGQGARFAITLPVDGC